MQANTIYTADLGNLFSISKDGVVPQADTTSIRSKGKKKVFTYLQPQACRSSPSLGSTDCVAQMPMREP
jgi:hypothetical protein